ncbi:MAG: hypothetical protein PF445_02065 [Melioribacteraceae bacterium]|nr:hypothetical protein [Melioribacteraceae bacterium]
MNKNAHLSRAILAGLIGTIGMTAFMMMGNIMGIQMNVPKMLASMFGGNLIIGWGMHFMVGTILAIGYEYFFIKKIKINNPLIRGAVYGILPWFIAQVMVMPMMSVMNGMSFFDGLFSGSLLMASASLMAHLVYGLVVGFIDRPSEKLVVSTSNV